MKGKSVRSFFSMLVFALAGFVASGDTSKPEHAAPHWTYEGEEGPSHWGSLSPDYSTCSAGKSQSPIEISHPVPTDASNLQFHYQPSKIKIINNGHTIQVNYDAGSYFELDGVRYDLQQFHFHAPSEHTINGKHAAAEMHLVHKNAEGKLAVVAILIDAGAQNSAFKSMWEHLPAVAGPVQQLTATVNAANMLPAAQTTYRYDGSLTTPPCSEGVKWIVMMKPIEISQTQINSLAQILKHDNRPIQPLNNRKVIEDSTP